MKKQLSTLMFLVLVVTTGCGKQNVEERDDSYDAFLDAFDNGDFPSTANIPTNSDDSKEKKYLEFLDKYDVSITFNSYYHGQSIETYRYSSKNNYVYHSNISKNSDEFIEEYYLIDESSDYFEHYYRSNEKEYQDSVSNEDYYVLFNIINLLENYQYVNPHYVQQIEKHKEQVNESFTAEYAHYYNGHLLLTDYQDYYFYLINNPEIPESFNFTTPAGGKVNETYRYLLRTSKGSLVKDTECIDFKYKIMNHKSHTFGTAYDRCVGKDLSNVTNHFVFENRLPVYFSTYYEHFGEQMYPEENCYHTAINISYENLPSNPEELFGIDPSIDEETGLLKIIK